MAKAVVASHQVGQGGVGGWWWGQTPTPPPTVIHWGPPTYITWSGCNWYGLVFHTVHPLSGPVHAVAAPNVMLLPQVG